MELINNTKRPEGCPVVHEPFNITCIQCPLGHGCKATDEMIRDRMTREALRQPIYKTSVATRSRTRG